MENYGLNNEQWGAVSAASPSLVHASAGSGKTRCLTAKIRLLLDHGAHPKSICSITFTNKAANEMKERIKAFCPQIEDMQVSTFHSMAVRIIRSFAKHTPLKVPFSIYDDSDQQGVIKTILKARDYKDDPYEIIAQISRAKSENALIDDDRIEKIRQIYQGILLKNNACDFDDLLIYARDCLRKEDCKSHYAGLWRHILVDEFQDTSTIQYEIINLIYDPLKTKTLFVVGDPNQSIYGWRQAKPENIEDFKKKYNPSVHNLTFNYRSAPEIISHANIHLQYGKTMVAKSGMKGAVSLSVFKDQEEEAAKIAEAIFKMGDYENTAILYRMNSRSLLFEKNLATRRIPYKVLGDLPYYRRKVAKDLLSFCKAATNPQDIESLARIVNVPKRGFGDAKQEKLLTEGWPYLHEMANEMPAIKDLVDLLNDIKGKKPFHAITDIIRETGYKESLTKETDLNMLDSFMNVVSGFSSIEELVLTSTFLEKDSGKGVKLMSVHASKGLEFNKVFVVGVEHEVWPHKLSLDIKEEERLYYVAVTRAKNYLNISYSKSKLYRGLAIIIPPSPLFMKSYNALYKKSS